MAILSINPVHQYLMNDGAATSTIADSGAGTTYDITKQSGTSPSVVTGIHNDGLHFGSSAQFNGSAPAPSDIIPSGASDKLSIALWFKIYNTSTATDFMGVTFGSTTSDIVWYLNIQSAGILSFSYSKNGTGASVGAQTDALTTNGSTWHHVVFTFDAATGDTIAYVDDGEGNTVNIGASPLHDGGVAAVFEMRRSGGDYAFDQVAIFNSILTAQDRTDLYNAGAGTSSEDLTEIPSYTDSGSSTLGALDTALSNNISKYTHPDGYDFYVRDGAAGKEGYSKAGTNAFLADVIYAANSDAGQKYVPQGVPTNTLLRLNGEDPNLMYEVTGSTETLATAYVKSSSGTLKSLGKVKAKEITLVNQTDVSYPLVLPLVAP